MLLSILYGQVQSEEKRGNLAGIFVYKFKVREQEILLAYEETSSSLLLMYVGPYENFYRDLKNQLH